MLFWRIEGKKNGFWDFLIFTASSSNNGWTAIGVCTFLVVVFATTTIYYWQKAKKMAKDMFANEKSGK